MRCAGISRLGMLTCRLGGNGGSWQSAVVDHRAAVRSSSRVKSRSSPGRCLPAISRQHHSWPDLQSIVSNAPSPVTVIQLGDSHTAGDKFSGRLRELLQQRYGDGRAAAKWAPEIHSAFFEPSLVAVLQTDGWRIENSRSGAAIGPFSISGYTVIGDDPNGFDGFAEHRVGKASTWWRSAPLPIPGGGSLEVLVDGRQVGVMRTEGNAHPAHPILPGRFTRQPPGRAPP